MGTDRPLRSLESQTSDPDGKQGIGAYIGGQALNFSRITRFIGSNLAEVVDHEGTPGYEKISATPAGVAGERRLASAHKCLRICDLCKELAFGTPRGLSQSCNSYNSFVFIVL